MNIKDIKEKLVSEYPLTKKMDCSFECYEVMKRRYVIFYDGKIDNKNSFDSLPDVFNDATKNFPKGTLLIGKTLIIVGHTNEEIKKKDLVVCNGNADTFIVYYLKNNSTNEIYFDDQWIYRLGLNWRKIVRKFNEILNS